jgi:hypothetical protein
VANTVTGTSDGFKQRFERFAHECCELGLLRGEHALHIHSPKIKPTDR